MRVIQTTIPLVGMALALSGCEFSPKQSTQWGPRGTAMAQIQTVAAIQKAARENYIPPEPYPLTSRDGPLATSEYKNVQVLTDLSTEEFNRLMASITSWVAPTEQGCNYCHNPENMASDEIYQKVVARRMLQMTRNINTNWSSHVKQTGVTCWTCHRGNGVPQYNWSMLPPEPKKLAGNSRGQNQPNPAAGYTSLPRDIFTPYLLEANSIRVGSQTPYGVGAATPIQAAERTTGLMMHTSKALGVNCTYCHNTNNFASWKYSTPQRVTAWYGYRMVRNMNKDYIQGLAPVFPAHRKGPMGDPLKVNCLTCHQGVNKPLGGVSMLPENPSLRGSRFDKVKAPAATETPNTTAALAKSVAKGG
ncbi:MAG: photosynthetic reaction center cytochrome PufC [Sphingomonadaceae bacterium]